MSYVPIVDDYVKWTDSIGNVNEGWVYFTCPQYITIEIGVKDKKDELVHFHKKTHVLLLCYNQDWHLLEYVKSRANQEDEYKSQPYRDSDLYS